MALLTKILNACLRLQYFPAAWKIATVITIRKPGKPPRDVASYRPISLLSALGKLFERLLLPRLQNFVDENEVLKDFQYGFLPGKSTTLQLHRVTKLLKSNIRSRMTTGMLAIDLQSAFDSVWHEGLIHKLITIGLPTYLVRLVQSYLNDRYFSVKVGSSLSQRREITAGVPQGGVLSPLLFNIYIHDLPCPADITIAQFADDTAALAKSHRTSTVVRRLQKAANAFIRYFRRWRIKLNPSKTEACLFGRKISPRHRPRTNVTVEGHQIPWTNNIKYLGMWLDKRLTYAAHIQQKIEKGEKMVLPYIHSLDEALD